MCATRKGGWDGSVVFWNRVLRIFFCAFDMFVVLTLFRACSPQLEAISRWVHSFHGSEITDADGVKSIY